MKNLTNILALALGTPSFLWPGHDATKIQNHVNLLRLKVNLLIGYNETHISIISLFKSPIWVEQSLKGGEVYPTGAIS